MSVRAINIGQVARPCLQRLFFVFFFCFFFFVLFLSVSTILSFPLFTLSLERRHDPGFVDLTIKPQPYKAHV